jgi:endonuclease/exonuclease/phosphatase family metal-dependent hydrolase
MTWNLLGAMGDDLVFSEHAGWAARVEQLEPDVLVLQEAQSDDVRAVLRRTSGEYSLASYVQWACDLKPEREGVAILVRSTVGLTGGGGRNVGASCLHPTLKRVLVWADLALPAGSLRIYGTHLSQPGVAYNESRDAQIRAIKQAIVDDDPADARRWLLAGDMNFYPRNRSYRLMMGDLSEEPGPYRFVDTAAEISPVSADPLTCPARPANDADAMAFLLENPELVRSCAYTAGWPKDDNWLACDVLSMCVSWEIRRDTSVRERLDYVLRAEGGPVSALRTFVPNRADPDWGSPGAEWFRLSDHLPYVVDVL